jgi:feruloyl esterase
MKRGLTRAAPAVVLFASSAVSAIAATPCESLRSLVLPQTNITVAASVPAGSFLPPGAAKPLTDVPAFCRVAATLTPTSDSDIKIEVWMPTSGWNGRFHGVGNGGFAGTMSYPALADAIARGDASASTDTGHSTPGGSFGMGHPEKIADWGYRSIHVMTEAAKAIIRAFYGNAARQSYFTGCSTGGHQALAEAQRYPADYDGIVAGDHGANRTHLHASFIWTLAATQTDPASRIPAEKFPVIHDAVLAACDALDGVSDGFLADPRRCRFDPATLRCPGGDGPHCLTASQVEALTKLYDGMRNPRTGEPLYPGAAVGSETRPGSLWTDIALSFPNFGDLFRFWVFEDLNWDWKTFDFDRDLARTDAKLGPSVVALNPDLSAFASRGGKLLLYHGWEDTRVSPIDSIAYFDSVAAFVDHGRKSASTRYSQAALRKTQAFARLFMVPGMGHCSGGPGPTSFDALQAVESWVERGLAPNRILAAHKEDGVTTMTRPLCPYPQEAAYLGLGSTNDAANFSCAVVTTPARSSSGK